jgi:hypothetical protein
MKKELSVSHEVVMCGVCGRTILKGERTEPYLVPDGSTRLVCELCTRRAESAGWLRADGTAAPAAPPRSEPRRSLLGRLRRASPENGPPASQADEGAPPAEEPGSWRQAGPAGSGGYERFDEAPAVGGDDPAQGYEPEPRHADEPPPDARAARRERRERRPLRDPRHVRAIPTGAEAKVERALELFNGSEFQRTVAGLMRTLGEPWVRAVPLEDSPSEVTVVVAWELSWYQYRVDLGDSDEPVSLERKGEELTELDEPMRHWNAGAGPDGALEPRTPA